MSRMIIGLSGVPAITFSVFLFILVTPILGRWSGRTPKQEPAECCDHSPGADSSFPGPGIACRNRKIFSRRRYCLVSGRTKESGLLVSDFLLPENYIESEPEIELCRTGRISISCGWLLQAPSETTAESGSGCARSKCLVYESGNNSRIDINHDH